MDWCLVRATDAADDHSRHKIRRETEFTCNHHKASEARLGAYSEHNEGGPYSWESNSWKQQKQPEKVASREQQPEAAAAALTLCVPALIDSHRFFVHIS